MKIAHFNLCLKFNSSSICFKFNFTKFSLLISLYQNCVVSDPKTTKFTFVHFLHLQLFSKVQFTYATSLSCNLVT